MTSSIIDFSSTKNDLRQLYNIDLDSKTAAFSEQPKSLLSDRPWKPELDPAQKFSEELTRVTTSFKNKITQAINHAKTTEDQKIKQLVCNQLLQMKPLIQQDKKEGVLKDLMDKCKVNPVLLQQLQTSISEMEIAVHNALIRGDDRQAILGTRFCSEEAFSDQHWEETMTMSRYLPQKAVSLFKYYVLYASSLAWTQVLSILSQRRWWNKITTTGPHQVNLYLGALPLATPFRNDLECLKKEKIGAILSMVEPFENHSPGWISSPITPDQWKSAGIQQLQISMEDFHTGSIADVELGVEFIRWNVLNGRSILVHCKAGRGRSALLLLAYLVKYENLSVEQAFTLMRSQRPHAGFKESDPKMHTLRQYAQRVALNPS